MNREAAAMGVPVYSIFRGEIGAVDRFLAKEQRLTLLERPEDLPAKVVLRHRRVEVGAEQRTNKTLGEVVEHIERFSARGGVEPRRQ